MPVSNSSLEANFFLMRLPLRLVGVAAAPSSPAHAFGVPAQPHTTDIHARARKITHRQSMTLITQSTPLTRTRQLSNFALTLALSRMFATAVYSFFLHARLILHRAATTASCLSRCTRHEIGRHEFVWRPESWRCGRGCSARGDVRCWHTRSRHILHQRYGCRWRCCGGCRLIVHYSCERSCHRFRDRSRLTR